MGLLGLKRERVDGTQVNNIQFSGEEAYIIVESRKYEIGFGNQARVYKITRKTDELVCAGKFYN